MLFRSTSLAENRDHRVTVFLLGDGILTAVAGQEKGADGRDMEWMLRRLGASGVPIFACGTCMDQRGVTAEMLVAEAERSTLPVLAALTAEADKVLVF